MCYVLVIDTSNQSAQCTSEDLLLVFPVCARIPLLRYAKKTNIIRCWASADYHTTLWERKWIRNALLHPVVDNNLSM